MATKGKGGPPKLNQFMHPRNPYRTPPSFKKLATQYPEFRTHCTYDLSGKVRLDFKNCDALRALTTCLLDQDFGLKVDIPDGRLVPTLPLRLNYLLWIEDLMALTARIDHKCTRIGVDIGTGSACIYPLLAAKQFGWSMLCTEADEVNYASAVNNVKKNDMQDEIFIRKVQENTIFKHILDDKTNLSEIAALQAKEASVEEESLEKPQGSQDSPRKAEMELGKNEKKDMESSNYTFDFTMCNPPFFSSEDDTYTMNKSKKDRGEPVSVPTGAVQEIVTSGGEVSFITQMIEESSQLKDKVRIFTTLIGTKADIKKIKQVLATVSPAHSSLTEFCQGRTMRWGLAWTFDPKLHLNQVMSKKQMANSKPMVMLLPRSLLTAYTVPAAWRMVAKWLHYLKVKVRVFKNTKYFVGAHVKAYKPTWLHQRRKKREIDRRNKEKMHRTKESDDMEIVGEGETLCKSKLVESDEEHPDIMEYNMNQNEAHSIEEPVEKQQPQKRSKDECEGEDQEESSHERKKPKISSEELNQSANGSEEKPTPYQISSPNDSGIGNSPDKEICSSSDFLRQISEKLHKEKEEPHVPQAGGLECILRFNIHLKQAGGLISLELTYLGGSAGKNGLGQLLLFMRNQLTNPTI
ncbi:RNA N6-adenosine-methyltransferase mettl16-like isoform X2 [Penaeus japonicus]|uniref:RNA N6-adenosine-methyltransferase mettl16-like isoform X2 n=1 Tax=Penaeus japonicus TaxID=27405 RepID=UPI001C70F986|nr:RNA N6-adenosine-methyltransferase mettl16-like isoform X2 [Penaeus japonicus]